MATIQLTDDTEISLPLTKLRCELSAAVPAQLILRDASRGEVQPFARISPTSFLVDPLQLSSAADGAGLTIAARPTEQHEIPPLSSITLNLQALPGSGAAPDVIRRQVTTRSAQAVAELVTLSRTPNGLIVAGSESEPVADARMTPQPWQDAGRQGYFALNGAVIPSPARWSIVIDGSAAMLRSLAAGEAGPLVETVIGIVAGATNRGPELAFIGGDQPREMAPLLNQASVPWNDVFGERPASWSALCSPLAAAARGLDASDWVVMVSGGLPVDAARIIAFAANADSPRILLVVIGRSQTEAVASRRPQQWWDEELDALLPLNADGRHRLVAVQAAGSAAADAHDIALGMVGSR